MIKNVALFFSANDEMTPYKQILQYETVRNNEVCVLSGCPYRGSFSRYSHHKKTPKESNNRVLLGALLFGCVVSFGVCNLCLDTYRRNHKARFDCITEYTTLSVFFSYSRCQISKISYSHVQDSQVTTLWSFLVVRNCFETYPDIFLLNKKH